MSEEKNLLQTTRGSSNGSKLNSNNHSQTPGTTVDKTTHLLYFTDPLCVTSYTMAPAIQQLVQNENYNIQFELIMGGLIPHWDIYRNGGISTFEDMATRWMSVGKKYGTLVDGTVWLKDPPHSSFPPAIAYKAAQLQSRSKALLFYQRVQHMIFVDNLNISRWEIIRQAAEECELDSDQLKLDMPHTARLLFEEDLIRAENYGVMGFPTLVIEKPGGKTVTLEGHHNYTELEQAVQSFVKAG